MSHTSLFRAAVVFKRCSGHLGFSWKAFYGTTRCCSNHLIHKFCSSRRCRSRIPRYAGRDTCWLVIQNFYVYIFLTRINWLKPALSSARLTCNLHTLKKGCYGSPNWSRAITSLFDVCSLQFLRIQLPPKIRQHLTNWTRWNKRKKFEAARIYFF